MAHGLMRGDGPSATFGQGGGEEGIVSALTFWSDWRTATGSTAPAITDGSKWTGDPTLGNTTGGTRVSIIAASGLDFPVGMTNVVQGRYRNSTAAESPTFWVIGVESGWALPAVGGMLIKRNHFRHTLIGSHSSTSGTTFHCVEPASGSCADEGEWVVNSADHNGSAHPATDADTTFLFRFKTKSHNWNTVLDKHETYRVEERWTREATNTWKTELRIYNSANVLVKDDGDFTTVGGLTLATQSATEKTTTTSATCLTHQNINWQGSDGNGRGSDDEDNNRIYYGGYAIHVSDTFADEWIGAYPHADEA